MREFTTDEILESLKDDYVHMTIVSLFFLRDINGIAQDLREGNRRSLAQLVTSNLLQHAVDELIAKNIIEDDELTNLGLAHIHLYLNQQGYADQIDQTGTGSPAQTTIDSKEFEDESNEIKAIVALSLSKFDLREIVQLFNERKEKILTYYLTKNLNDAGIKKLLDYNFITLQNTITNAGWAEIESFIKLSGARPIANELEVLSNVKTDRLNNIPGQEGKKYWQFWK